MAHHEAANLPAGGIGDAAGRVHARLRDAFRVAKVLTTVLCLAGCGAQQHSGDGQVNGQALFENYCAECHIVGAAVGARGGSTMEKTVDIHGRAVNDIYAAIGEVPQMQFLQDYYFSERQVQAISVYLAQLPPQMDSTDCNQCHGLGDGTGSLVPFDHAQMVGVCVDCHDGQLATGKSARHIVTSDKCESCHSTQSWRPAITMDHGEVVGACVSCHDGRSAQGKSAGHVSSGDDCAGCHSFQHWVPALVDHSQIAAGSCASCHNGVNFLGKSATHIPSNDECDACHTVSAWLPARFTHVGVVTNCVSCHDLGAAVGMPIPHLPTSSRCEACHQSFLSWLVVSVDHGEVVGACASCHDGVSATGKSPSHPVTSDDVGCDACHNTAAWVP